MKKNLSLKKNTLRMALSSYAILTSVCFSAAGVATDESKQLFTIHEQPLSAALNEFGAQAGLQIAVSEELVEGHYVLALNGVLTAERVLQTLLNGTGISYTFVNDNTLVLEKGALQYISFNTSADYEPYLRAYEGDENADDVDAFEIDEIVVTATKRATSLQDTAMTISAVGSEDIDRRELIGMDDYLHTIPGVSLVSVGAGANSIIMRGLSVNPDLDGNNVGPLAGLYFGDTPLSGLGAVGGQADVKLVDMERIEILKGPQGTLYGAGAMGGVVRNIPASPDLEGFSGNVTTHLSNTARLGGTNSDIQAMVNVPLVRDELAIRAVGYHFDVSGFYRNISAVDPFATAIADSLTAGVTIQDDIGAETYTGGRISLLWKPDDKFSVQVSYLHQEIDQFGRGNADTRLGDGYEQSRFQVSAGSSLLTADAPITPESMKDILKIASATIEYDLGWAELVSATSYVKEKTFLQRDGAAFFSPTGPWSQNGFYEGKGLSEELRLHSQFDGAFQFVAGYYFEKREAGFSFANFFGGADNSLRPEAWGFGQITADVYREDIQHALFGEVSYDLNDSLKVTAGARGFDIKKKADSVTDFDTFAGNMTNTETSASDVSWKAGVDYRPNDDMLFFGLWSQGFRLGDIRDANTQPTCDTDGDGFFDDFPNISTGVGSLDSDSIDNYELGSKLTMLDGRLLVNTSIYQMNWKDIPVTAVMGCGRAVTLAAGEARTRGVEFETSYYINSSFKLDVSASYVKAKITEGGTGVGQTGDRLAGAPEFSTRIGLAYDFELAGNDAYIQGDYAYTGNYYAQVGEQGPKLGDYGLINLNMGVRLGNVDLSVYAKNLTNEDDLTSAQVIFLNTPFQRHSRLRPRTVGLRLGYDF